MKLDVQLRKRQGQFNLSSNFNISGERIGLFGPSGSGKSTLSQLIAGLISPDEGTICLNDQYLFCSKRKINLAAEKRRIAVVFQQAHLFPHLSVEDNLLFGAKRIAKAERKINFNDLVKVLDISHLLKRSVTKLSGGERQRVGLGRALLASPKLLIFDEPLSALDQKLKDQLIPYLRKTLRRFSIPYLYISHSLREVRLLTDQVIHFTDNGKIQEVTDAETLARRRMADAQSSGYMNHLTLENPREVGSLLAYQWGSNEMLLTDHQHPQSGLFEVSSKDILLFKNHPRAISARNLLKATVNELIPKGGNVGIRLDCNGEELIAQTVREAAIELNIEVGTCVFLAIKASSFRRVA